jgi:hypothetical protein
MANCKPIRRNNEHSKANPTVVLAALLAEPSFAQKKGVSACTVEYENHNQIDCIPLVFQEVKGTITDPQQSAVPKVCIGIFTERDHKLVAMTESDAEASSLFKASLDGINWL